MAAQAKLLAALKKKPDDEDAPRPEMAPIAPTADRDQLKMRKGNLRSGSSWDGALEKIEYNNKHDFMQLLATVEKMYTNVMGEPANAKFRKINYANPNFVARCYSMKGAPELFEVAGWKKDGVEQGSLVLPMDADLELLRRALAALQAQAATRQENDEKKRKLDLEAAAKAREARAQKAREAAEPGAYDQAVAGASAATMMADEDEAMIDAISAYLDAHPDSKSADFDCYDVERQVGGPGGTVIASVTASVGTQYFDLVAHMKREDGGAWRVLKVLQA
jgi:hypothetical protein